MSDNPHDTIHDHTPHIYVIYWPDLATIKVGITTTQERWEWWCRRGAVTIAVTDTCCEEHARRIEKRLLGHLKNFGAPAFKSAEDARLALGGHRGGYTECYRLVQSPRYGDEPYDENDYERAYGLILPKQFDDDLNVYRFVAYPIVADHRRTA